MSVLEEKLTYDRKDGTPTYTLLFSDFQDKMKNWPPGERITSNVFKVHDVCVSIQVYPNGHKVAHKGYVSVYLSNKSDKQIFVHATFKMNGKEVSIKGPLGPGRMSGHKRLVSYWHNIANSSFLSDVEQLACEIHQLTTDKGVWETSNKTDCLKNDFESKVRYETKKIKEDLSKMQGTLNERSEKLDRIEKMQEKLDKKLDVLMTMMTRNNNLVKPECPVCFDEMTSETKIAQCISGHHLCWSCKKKLRKNQCPSCKLPVNGRAFGMENYMKTLFK